MKVTLYKKCVLSKAYQNVYATQIRLNTYLQTLQSKEITLNTVYPKFTDEFIITNSDFTIMEYNYLKIDYEYEDTQNNFSLYMFIDKIEIMNKVAKVFVSMDYWHSYWKKVNFHKGLLNITTEKDVNYPKKIITPQITRGITIENNGEVTRCSLFIEMQIYTIDNMGEVSDRHQKSFMLGISSVETTLIRSFQYDIKITQEYIEKIIRYQSKNEIIANSTGNPRLYYDIIDMYMLPSSLTSNKFVFIEDIIPDYYFLDEKVTDTGQWREEHKYLLYETKFDNNLVELITIPITADYSISKVGVYGYLLDYVYNGEDINLTFYTYKNPSTFQVYMTLGEELIDITSCYKVNEFFTAVTGETAYTKSMAQGLANMQGITSVISGIASIGMAAAIPAIGIGSAATQMGMSLGQASSGVGSISSAMSSFTQASTVNILTGSANKNVDNPAFLNCSNTYVILKKHIVNSQDINNNIFLYGYEYNITTYVLSPTFENENEFDYYKFNNVELSGLSENILEVIRNILLNGVRIWTNGTIH